MSHILIASSSYLKSDLGKKLSIPEKPKYNVAHLKNPAKSTNLQPPKIHI